MNIKRFLGFKRKSQVKSFRSPTIEYLCAFLGRSLVGYMLNVESIEDLLNIEGAPSKALEICSIYEARLIDCGTGIACIQFTASGPHGTSVAESIRNNDFEQARATSNWWASAGVWKRLP